MPAKVGIHDFPVVRCKVVDADLRRHDCGEFARRLHSHPSTIEDVMSKPCVTLGLLLVGFAGLTMPCNAAEIVGIDGQCLDVQGGGKADGTPVILYHCRGTPNQQWFYSAGQIVGSGGKCLDIQGGKADDGARIVMFHCHGGPNQQWSFYNSQIVGMGGKCLDAEGGRAADGTAVVLFHCHGAANQRWSTP
jgi:hypothetical protein